MSIFNRTTIPYVAPDVRGDLVDAVSKLGVDLNPDNVDALTVADLVRLAYREGVRATEKRVMSPDTADAIATAVGDPSKVLQIGSSDAALLHWRVRAIQQAAVYGVPK